MQFRNLALKSVHHVESSSRAFCSFLKTLLLALLFGVVLFSSTAIADTYPERPVARRIHFVKKAATGNNNGSTWEHAFNYLQDALAVAQPGDEIWMAQGVYHPDEGEGFTEGDRDAAFRLVPGTKLIGGFSGTIGKYDSDPERYPTKLSGDLKDNDGPGTIENDNNRIENSTLIVIAEAQNTDSSALNSRFYIEGVTIEKSSAYGGLNARDSQLELIRVTFTNHIATGRGGGIYAFDSDLKINDCKFLFNEAPSGAAISALLSDVLIRNSQFIGNKARRAGAILSLLSSITIEGALFLNNISETEGGAIGYARPKGQPNLILNTVFVGNEAGEQAFGAAVIAGAEGSYLIINSTFFQNRTSGIGAALTLFTDADVGIYNSIIWDNPSDQGSSPIDWMMPYGQVSLYVANSIIEGGLPSFATDLGGNFSTNPVFVDAVGPDGVKGTGDEDVSLAPDSPAIDAGTVGYLPPDSLDRDFDMNMREPYPFDFSGNPRVQAGGNITAIPDIGAYEYSSTFNPEFAQPLGFSVFPNPATDQIGIRLKKDPGGIIEVMIFNISGRLVREDFVSGAGRESLGFQIPTLDLSSGMYVLHVESGMKRGTTLFSIIK